MKYSTKGVVYAIIFLMNTQDTSHIRNFSIVAHIDHGKSTISDRILELTHTVEERDMESQLLDTMDIERERGITIKSNAVRVMYDADDGERYQFNLIDTPGHVDFTYEVSRSLAACEGAVLVVDATQGVEAQTVSNAMLAMNANLDIVPAINKIDLPSARPEEVRAEIEDVLAIPADDAVCVSGKQVRVFTSFLRLWCTWFLLQREILQLHLRRLFLTRILTSSEASLQPCVFLMVQSRPAISFL